jgi:predicted nucleotidyltransferase
MEEVVEIVHQKFKNLEILNVYLFGSRLYNCHTKTSDYDLILITNLTEIDLSQNVIETEKYNINIYNIDYFIFLMQENFIWALMCCWIPKNFIWKETFSIKPFAFVNKKKLSNHTIMDISHCYVKAKKMIHSHVGFKNLAHCFREAIFSLEILKEGKLQDFEIANHYFERIMKEEGKNWEYLDKIFYEELHERMTELKNFKFISEQEERMNLSEYLQKYELNCLCRDFAITLSNLDGELVYVNVIDSDLVDFKLPIVRECKGGIVFDSKKNIIARGVLENFKKSFKSIKRLQKMDGVNTLLFWREKWILVFKDSIKPKYYRKMATNKVQDNFLINERLLSTKTLEERFWKIFESSGMKIPSRKYSYNFELCLKGAKICQYTEDSLYLISVFDPESNSFCDIFEIAKVNQFQTSPEIPLEFDTNPLKSEGYVEMDENYHFQFHKSLSFTELKHLEFYKSYDDNTLKRMIFDIVRDGKKDDFLKLDIWNDPNLIQLFKEVEIRYHSCIQYLNEITVDLSKIPIEKLSLECKKYPFYYIIFEKIKSGDDYEKTLQMQTQKRFQKILKEIESYKKNLNIN